MSMLRRVWAAIGGYIGSNDPLVAASNMIALVIVANQPAYPLYVWWLVGDDRHLSLLTFVSTPLFTASPAIARRWPVAGRAWLPLVGILNTGFCSEVFGGASGVGTFLLPCAVIGAMSFRRNEPGWAPTILMLSAFACVALNGLWEPPSGLFSPSEYASLRTMNAIAALCLSVFAAFQFARARTAS